MYFKHSSNDINTLELLQNYDNQLMSVCFVSTQETVRCHSNGGNDVAMEYNALNKSFSMKKNSMILNNKLSKICLRKIPQKSTRQRT